MIVGRALSRRLCEAGCALRALPDYAPRAALGGHCAQYCLHQAYSMTPHGGPLPPSSSSSA